VDELTRLLLAARDGDRDALATFVARTQADVHRFCAVLGSPASAEDLSQETYLRALGALPAFRGEAPARGWLLSIARRTAADRIRRRDARRRLQDRLGPVEATAPDPGDGLHAADLLGHLDPDRRAAFALTQLLGLSYAETADVLECPVGTVRSRVARAREDLLSLLAEDVDDGGDAGSGDRAGEEAR
jgi:RNA polymerase sigma-70 factor (ECF subfamily)